MGTLKATLPPMPSVYRDFQAKNSVYYISGQPRTCRPPDPLPVLPLHPHPYISITALSVLFFLQRGGRHQNASEHLHLGELWFFPEFSVQNICYITSIISITSPDTVKTFQSCTIPPGPADPDGRIGANTHHRPPLIP